MKYIQQLKTGHNWFLKRLSQIVYSPTIMADYQSNKNILNLEFKYTSSMFLFNFLMFLWTFEQIKKNVFKLA